MEYYNPKLVIEPIKYNDITLNIIRDDHLTGGTKQRGVIPLIQNSEKNRFVYAGPNNGYAQIALAYACKLSGKKCIIFVKEITPIHPFTQLAKKMGAIIKPIKNGYLKKIQNIAETYSIDNNCELIPFGVDTQEFIDYMIVNLKLAIPDDLKPKKIWLVGGSATLLKILYVLFPDTVFGLVQVGKTIWKDQIDLDRTTKYVAPEKFTEDAEILPPYPSVSTYDAKVWQFVIKYGEDGDYVWNVAKDL